MESRREDPAVAAIYRDRLASRRASAARHERRHAALAWTRLGVFGLAVALLAVFGRASAPWLAVPLVAFVVLLFVHARVLNARDRAARAVDFYDRGLARVEERWRETGESGERFRDPQHLYAEDLDLFGPGGLFELLDTTRTRGGENVLAGWLMAPAAPAVVRARQRAVADLAARVDLREDLAVLGPDVQAAIRTEELTAWAAAPPQLAGTWPRLMLAAVAAVSTSLVIAWMWTGEPPGLLVPALALQALAGYRYRHAVHHVSHGIAQREAELRVLAVLIDRIEREAFESDGLRELQARLRATGHSPADDIRRLARRVEILSSGHNQIFAPVSALLLLGTQLAFAVENWRMRYGPAVAVWLAVVSECEALAAIGTYAAEHPGDPFPELVDGPPRFEADSLAHPLLPAAVAVPSDLRLGGDDPALLIVSGSNMSGKSTLLRTVGLNAVLAQAAAPVRARRLRMTPLAIGATLRIQDSLQAGRSRFFAEIGRISAIVSLAASTSVPDPSTSVPDPSTSVPDPSTSVPDPSTSVLFLFDELLTGTNSHDRLLGATGILRTLAARGAIGLVTTHDLALTRLADELGARAANVHFEDRFEEGRLTFDYRLQPGVVRSSTALPLMRSVGLDV